MNQAKLVESLEKARELIKIGWIRSAWARDSKHQHVNPWDESACEWCTEGAILGATHFDDDAEELAKACVTILQATNKEFVGNPINARKILHGANNTTRIDNSSIIPSLNDSSHTTQEQVVRWFDHAIQFAKKAKFK